MLETDRLAGTLYINGSFRGAESGDLLPVLEKATGEMLAVVADGGAADVDAAVRQAAAVQPSWEATPGPERAAILRAAADNLEARTEQFVDQVVRETGAIPAKARYEVISGVGHLLEAAALALRPLGDVLPSADPHRVNTTSRKPVGVVATITPWNLPILLAMHSVAPAIALANTCVLKPAPATPMVGGLMLADLFDQAGLPAGVLNVVPGGDDAGRALVAHELVDMVHFTGSTQAGRHIAEAAGRALKRVALELGGNNALVVLDDADPDRASMVGAWSSFHYQGQTCISAGRHLVARSKADEYVACLQSRAARLRVGDPTLPGTQLGPLISESQRDRAVDLLQRSVQMGAQVVEGGSWDGLFFRPTVVVDVSPEMPLYREEIFAPIAPVVVTDSEEHALALVNDTPYGLSNAVVGADPWRARRFASRTRSGMVHVNETTALAEPHVPFLGRGISGIGPGVGGDASIEQFTQRQWLSVRHEPPSYPY